MLVFAAKFINGTEYAKTGGFRFYKNVKDIDRNPSELYRKIVSHFQDDFRKKFSGVILRLYSTKSIPNFLVVISFQKVTTKNPKIPLISPENFQPRR